MLAFAPAVRQSPVVRLLLPLLLPVGYCCFEAPLEGWRQRMLAQVVAAKDVRVSPRVERWHDSGRVGARHRRSMVAAMATTTTPWFAAVADVGWVLNLVRMTKFCSHHTQRRSPRRFFAVQQKPTRKSQPTADKGKRRRGGRREGSSSMSPERTGRWLLLWRQ